MTISNNIPLAREAVRELDIDIVPGVRQRLIAELDRRGIHPGQREHFLSQITGRALQTVARWIDQEKPGLPDLKSLAIVCLQFDMDANWILGLTSNRLPFPKQQLSPRVQEQVYGHEEPSFDWIGNILGQTASFSGPNQVAVMKGDDMAPLIHDGAPFFFDATVNEVEVNGIYVLDYQGRRLVRHIEIIVGEGLLLRCENQRYNSTLVKLSKAMLTLTILGRVKAAINIKRF